MKNPLKNYDMFATPESWKVVEQWIERHEPESRIHLYTAAFMALNLAHTIVQEAIDKES